MRYAFAGDRSISCNILRFIIKHGYEPAALLVGNKSNSSHASELINISGLEKKYIFFGNDFKTPSNIDLLREMNLDYIFGIHFPYIIPNPVLEIPKIGFLNLHPAFLPYNKGWHTPSWAILDKTPYGATLHFMAEALDKGDIIHQRELAVAIEDTANSLYQKVLKLEEKIFYEAFDDLVKLNPKAVPQNDEGSSHNRRDLKAIQEIKLEEKIKPIDLIDKLRALTTNKPSELAFIEIDGKRIGIKVELIDVSDKKEKN